MTALSCTVAQVHYTVQNPAVLKWLLKLKY